MSLNRDDFFPLQMYYLKGCFSSVTLITALFDTSDVSLYINLRKLAWRPSHKR